MVKIVCISDTHNKHDEAIVPECDILLCSGDFSGTGTANEVKNFLDWFSVQPAKHIVYIAGNHDLSYEDSPNFKEKMIGLYPNINYLEASGITLCGLNIWGDPHQPEFCDWAFNLPRGKRLQEQWAKIPENTDVLLTHGPPYGIMDEVSFTGECVGDYDLLERINQLKHLSISCYGHIHQQKQQVIKSGNIIFVNAAICDDRYYVINQPVVVDL